jgi:hypothetical protein
MKRIKAEVLCQEGIDPGARICYLIHNGEEQIGCFNGNHGDEIPVGGQVFLVEWVEREVQYGRQKNSAATPNVPPGGRARDVYERTLE